MQSGASPAASPLLSPRHLESFARLGWVALPGFCDGRQVRDLLAWTNALTAQPEQPGRAMLYREPSVTDPTTKVIQRIENFCPFHKGFDALVRSGALIQAVGEVMGGPVCLFKDKINFKMPGGAGFAPHQDQQAGWSRYAPLFVTALVCLDRATLENGCLEMATIPRLHSLIAPEWRPMSDEEMAGIEFVPVPTEPGDVLLFDSYAPHLSKPNLTASSRRILYLTYNLLSDGDHRDAYFSDKRKSFPPDIEREPGKTYTFRV